MVGLLASKGTTVGQECWAPGVWCAVPFRRGGGQIGLLTTDVDSKHRVGVNLCLDLRCSQRLESAANLAGRSVLDESKRLIERMARFAHEALGIQWDPG